jgi:hypothetical protein
LQFGFLLVRPIPSRTEGDGKKWREDIQEGAFDTNIQKMVVLLILLYCPSALLYHNHRSSLASLTDEEGG